MWAVALLAPSVEHRLEAAIPVRDTPVVLGAPMEAAVFQISHVWMWVVSQVGPK